VLVARQLSEYVIFPHQRFITTQSQVRIATRHPRRRACPSRSCTVKSVGAQVRIASASSSASDTPTALAEAFKQLRSRLGERPRRAPHHTPPRTRTRVATLPTMRSPLLLVRSWICIYPTVKHDAATVVNEAAKLVPPGVPVHGASSCAQVMTENGPVGDEGCAVGMWGIHDPEGHYHSVAIEELGANLEASTAHQHLPASSRSSSLSSRRPSRDEMLRPAFASQTTAQIMREALHPLLEEMAPHRPDMVWLAGRARSTTQCRPPRGRLTLQTRLMLAPDAQALRGRRRWSSRRCSACWVTSLCSAAPRLTTTSRASGNQSALRT
jgi:hypothetical protein